MIRYPADAWTNFELATLLNRAQPRKLDEAIRYYTVARALRPDSGWDLAQVLQQQGRDDEALRSTANWFGAIRKTTACS